MSKHISIEDRQTIAFLIMQGHSLGDIAKQIGKAQTTVSREILNHRTIWDKKPYGWIVNRCVKRRECIMRNACKSGCKQGAQHVQNATAPDLRTRALLQAETTALCM